MSDRVVFNARNVDVDEACAVRRWGRGRAVWWLRESNRDAQMIEKTRSEDNGRKMRSLIFVCSFEYSSDAGDPAPKIGRVKDREMGVTPK